MTRRGGAPLVLAVPAVAALLVVVLPLIALLGRTPWTRLPELLTTSSVQQALWLSLRCSAGAVALTLLLGVPLAWVLARSSLPGRRLLRAIVTVPLVLPPVVGGVALLLAFGRRGVLGPLLVETGSVPAFTPYGVVLAEAFVAMPFLVLTVEGALAALDRGREDVAATLGAGPVRTLFTVTLPAIAPSVGAGAALAAARALGEFGATITFAGSLPGVTQTVPLAVYQLLEDDPRAAYALSAVLLLVSVGLVAGLRARVR
ncbi:MAG: molybdate transport system permease protein [Actinomycetota bacterium]|jgi:molybdate transport system permease protein|nr:molybdate transport system permease protein [Actinomycetota bacterium]